MTVHFEYLGPSCGLWWWGYDTTKKTNAVQWTRLPPCEDVRRLSHDSHHLPDSKSKFTTMLFTRNWTSFKRLHCNGFHYVSKGIIYWLVQWCSDGWLKTMHSSLTAQLHSFLVKIVVPEQLCLGHFSVTHRCMIYSVVLCSIAQYCTVLCGIAW